jgi:hypothetical protein
MKKKIILFITIISLLLGPLNNVFAEEINPSITNEILNKYSNNITYLEKNISIIKGNLNKDISVDAIIGNIDFSSLEENYGITNISITYQDGTCAKPTEKVTSGMKLVFTLDDDSTITYEISIVGDINGDGIINNSDISSIVTNYLGDVSISYINDINQDGIFNILDITKLLHSITTNSWENDHTAIDNLSSELSNSSNEQDIVVGEEVELKYTIKNFNSDFINGIEGKLYYDNDLLELVSFTVDNSYGNIRSDGKFLYLLNNYSGTDALITMRFKTKSSGNATVSLNDIKAAMDGVSVNLDSNSISTTIKIIEKGQTEDNFTDDKNNQQTTSTTPRNNKVNTTNNNSTTIKLMPTNLVKKIYKESVTYVKLSSNNYIGSMTIKDYHINFNKDTLEYSIEVEDDVDSLDLDIVLSSNVASYEIIGNENFKTGKNIVQVVVTAEDGSTKTYLINVNKKSKTSTKTTTKSKEKNSNSSRVVIIILIILIIIGLIYIIFKDDEEEEREQIDKKE